MIFDPRTPSEVLASAIERHAPSRIFACFSGGDDSLVSTHWAMNNGAQEVFHINTGIGVDESEVGGPAVEEIVREACARYAWPLRVETPPKMDYRAIVLKFGFPGPGAHYLPYRWLKLRAVEKLVRETKIGRRDRVGLLTGVHKSESTRRMGYVEPIVRFGAQLWIAPLWNWTKLEISSYRKGAALPRSPIAEILGMSGECLCGSFAKPAEIKRIEALFPCTAKRIYMLQDEARAAGKPCKWGVRPPKNHDSQYDIPFMPFCVNCHSHEATTKERPTHE